MRLFCLRPYRFWSDNVDECHADSGDVSLPYNEGGAPLRCSLWGGRTLGENSGGT